MLTAEGVVAKVITFVVQKAIGRLVSLSFGKRRKACRALTKLYFCVQSLHEAGEDVLRTFDCFHETKTKADALVNALNNHKYDVELATNMFIDLSMELHDGLELIDPVLARCCYALYMGKRDFLNYMSNSVHWEDRTEGRARMVLKRPQGLMEQADLESMYELTKKALEAGDDFYWPPSVFEDFDDDFREVSVGFEDEAVASELHEMLVRQNALLKDAKERLRELIKNSFSIEEVLFQSDTRPFRR